MEIIMGMDIVRMSLLTGMTPILFSDVINYLLSNNKKHEKRVSQVMEIISEMYKDVNNMAAKYNIGRQNPSMDLTKSASSIIMVKGMIT